MTAAYQRRLASELLTEVDELVGRLRRDLPDLVAHAAVGSSYDGFPSATLGDGGSAGGTTDTLAERVVADLTPGTDWEGEPTGRPDRDRDPVVTAVATALVELQSARRRLRVADDQRARAKDLQTPDKLSVRADPTQGCVNCDRFDVWSTVHKAGRCRACYEYRRRHDGRDAPERLVLARPEVGGRRQAGPVDPGG